MLTGPPGWAGPGVSVLGDTQAASVFPEEASRAGAGHTGRLSIDGDSDKRAPDSQVTQENTQPWAQPAPPRGRNRAVKISKTNCTSPARRSQAKFRASCRENFRPRGEVSWGTERLAQWEQKV